MMVDGRKRIGIFLERKLTIISKRTMFAIVQVPQICKFESIDV